MAERWALTEVFVARWDPVKYRWGVKDEIHHPDATLRSEGNPNRPTAWGLRVVRERDPETGTTLDADGDRSVEYHSIEAVDVTHYSDGVVSVVGFVEDRDPDGRPTGAFRKEKWLQRPYNPTWWGDA